VLPVGAGALSPALAASPAGRRTSPPRRIPHAVAYGHRAGCDWAHPVSDLWFRGDSPQL